MAESIPTELSLLSDRCLAASFSNLFAIYYSYDFARARNNTTSTCNSLVSGVCVSDVANNDSCTSGTNQLLYGTVIGY